MLFFPHVCKVTEGQTISKMNLQSGVSIRYGENLEIMGMKGLSIG